MYTNSGFRNNLSTRERSQSMSSLKADTASVTNLNKTKSRAISDIDKVRVQGGFHENQSLFTRGIQVVSPEAQEEFIAVSDGIITTIIADYHKIISQYSKSICGLTKKTIKLLATFTVGITSLSAAIFTCLSIFHQVSPQSSVVACILLVVFSIAIIFFVFFDENTSRDINNLQFKNISATIFIAQTLKTINSELYKNLPILLDQENFDHSINALTIFLLLKEDTQKEIVNLLSDLQEQLYNSYRTASKTKLNKEELKSIGEKTKVFFENFFNLLENNILTTMPNTDKNILQKNKINSLQKLLDNLGELEKSIESLLVSCGKNSSITNEIIPGILEGIRSYKANLEA